MKTSSFRNLSHKSDRKSSSQCVHAILREYWISHKRQKFIVLVHAACVLLCEQRLVISLKHLWHWSHSKGFSIICSLLPLRWSSFRLQQFSSWLQSAVSFPGWEIFSGKLPAWLKHSLVVEYIVFSATQQCSNHLAYKKTKVQRFIIILFS